MNPVAGESQQPIHLAQTARQASIVRSSVLHFDAALRKWLTKRSTDRHMDRSKAGGGEIRDEAAEQFEINLSVRREIKCLRSHELNRAVPNHVSPVSHQMGLGDVDGLV